MGSMSSNTNQWRQNLEAYMKGEEQVRVLDWNYYLCVASVMSVNELETLMVGSQRPRVPIVLLALLCLDPMFFSFHLYHA
jgi:hypothetical protein